MAKSVSVNGIDQAGSTKTITVNQFKSSTYTVRDADGEIRSTQILDQATFVDASINKKPCGRSNYSWIAQGQFPTMNYNGGTPIGTFISYGGSTIQFNYDTSVSPFKLSSVMFDVGYQYTYTIPTLTDNAGYITKVFLVGVFGEKYPTTVRLCGVTNKYYVFWFDVLNDTIVTKLFGSDSQDEPKPEDDENKKKRYPKQGSKASATVTTDGTWEIGNKLVFLRLKNTPKNTLVGIQSRKETASKWGNGYYDWGYLNLTNLGDCAMFPDGEDLAYNYNQSYSTFRSKCNDIIDLSLSGASDLMCLDYRSDGKYYFYTGNTTKVEGSLVSPADVPASIRGKTYTLASGDKGVEIRINYDALSFNFRNIGESDWIPIESKYVDSATRLSTTWGGTTGYADRLAHVYLFENDKKWGLCGVDFYPISSDHCLGNWVYMCYLPDDISAILTDIFGYGPAGEDEDEDAVTPAEKEVIEELSEDITGGTGDLPSPYDNTSDAPLEHDGSWGDGTGTLYGDDEAPKEISDPTAGWDSTLISGGGFLKIYNPTKPQFQNFASELNSSDCLNVIKEYFHNNPMDGIIGCHAIPYTLNSTTTNAPKIGTYQFQHSMNVCPADFIVMNYGSRFISCSYSDSWADITDTAIEIFLPHIGVKSLDTQIVMNSTITLKYYISVLTGDITAVLYAQRGSETQHPVYTWQGSCALTIPITHTDHSNVIQGAMNIASGVGSIARGSLAISGGLSGESVNPQQIGGGANLIVSGANSTLAGVKQTMSPTITSSGTLSGASAYMSFRQPFLIYSRPIFVSDGTSTESKYCHDVGKPYCCQSKLNQMQGYTEMINPDLSAVPCTEQEKSEIESLLRGGIYI